MSKSTPLKLPKIENRAVPKPNEIANSTSEVMRKKLLLRSLAVMLFCLTALFISAQETTTLHGKVSYHKDGIRVLQNVTVKLFDVNGNLVATTLTDSNGNYEFPDLPNGTYTLKAASNNPAGGVSVASAIRIMKHINGQQPLSPMGKLAADVNGDGLITVSDFVSVLTGYLVHGNPFPIGEWIFEEQTIELDGLKSSTWEKGIGGSSTGDTGGAFEPAISNDPIHFFASGEIIQASPGNEFAIAIKAAERFEMAGMHLAINFPSHLLEIIELKAVLDHVDFKISGNQIILSSADAAAKSNLFKKGDELVTMVVKTTGLFTQNDQIIFTLNESSHFVNENFEKISPRISLPAIGQKKEKSSLMANFPNPFSVQTKVNYKLTEASSVNISIYSLDGRLITNLLNDYQAEGVYQVEFNKGSLNPGAYILRLQTDGLNPVNDTRVMIITSD